MKAILTLDAALAGCSAAVVAGSAVLACRTDPAGQAAPLAAMARDVLREAGVALDGVAVTVGPGSFTGLRAALALAHGIALGSGVPVLGVTVGEALACHAPPGRLFWTAIDSKRGRVFLERDGQVRSVALDDLPRPGGPVAVAGDAASAVAERLAASGADVQALDLGPPGPLGIALAVARGINRPAQPLYVDPPSVKPGPAGRPAPV